MRKEQKSVELYTELIYRFTPPYSASFVTYVMDLTSGTGTNVVIYILKLSLHSNTRPGTCAIAGLHVPGTQVICIERDPEVFELSEARVSSFIDEGKFLLPQVYAIFAKLKIIPSKGASRAAHAVGEVSSSDDDTSGSHSSDGASGEDQQSDEDEEAVDPMALLQCRLTLRPTHECCVAGGYTDRQTCAVIETASYKNIGIRRSRIDNGGLGVFALKHIKRDEQLLPYWGDIYVASPETVGDLIVSLNTERLVQTSKYIKDSGKNQT